MIIVILFFLTVSIVVYTYLGYPLLVSVLSRLCGRPLRRAPFTPRVSIIIAAHNEEQDIAAKIENTLALQYPPDKLEIIIASDCSTDRTDDIVQQYAAQGVRLYRQRTHLGKNSAQHQAVGLTTGEILLFSDATTMYAPQTVRQIVRNFTDPEVGCVAGQLEYVDRSQTAVGKGCRSYWGYEKFIKRCESRLESLIGVSGCLYAVRRSSYARLSRDMIDDFVIATEIHLQGLRTVYEPEAIAMEDTNNRTRDEFRMRVRVIEQTLSVLYRYRAVLHPGYHGLYAFQMISHKVLRYIVPFCLLLALPLSGLLMNTSRIFLLIYLGQLAFYGAACFGWIGDRLRLRLGPLALPYYFTLVNLAVLVAWLKFINGESHVVWEPVRQPRTVR